MSESSGKQVIARAAAVLRALAARPGGLSLSQIAAATALPRSTVQRIVAALEAQNFVSTGSGGVRLGPAIARLAASAEIDVVAAARPHIETLGQRTRETVDLSVLRIDHAVLVAHHVGDQELRVASPVGAAFPMHCTAHGKALLAAFTDEEARQILGGRLERRTERTVVCFDALAAEFAEIRRQGHAFDGEEHAEGVCGLGVTLRAPSSERYALSLAAPVQRMARARDHYLAELLSCRAAIEAALGSRP